MKSKKLLLGGMLVLCMVFGAGVAAGAAANKEEPGSSGDPIVTKSYVDQQISKIQSGGQGTNQSGSVSSAEITELQRKIDTLQQENNDLKDQIATLNKETAKGNFKKVTVKEGKTLVTKYGAEVLFYSGSATWKTTNNTYVVDQTAGTHVKNGALAVAFHNYLIRSGSDLTAAKDSVVYVKGTYSVKTK